MPKILKTVVYAVSPITLYYIHRLALLLLAFLEHLFHDLLLLDQECSDHAILHLLVRTPNPNTRAIMTICEIINAP
jgi:hypothetical protein